MYRHLKLFRRCSDIFPLHLPIQRDRQQHVPLQAYLVGLAGVDCLAGGHPHAAQVDVTIVGASHAPHALRVDGQAKNTALIG
jgi:hypothetical protein